MAQDVKVRCIETLLPHLETIRQTGSGLLDGPREGRYGSRAMVSGAAGKRLGVIVEEFCGVLDGLDEEMDGAHKSLVKGGVSVGGWKGKKTGVSGSTSSQMSADRMELERDVLGLSSVQDDGQDDEWQGVSHR